MAILEVRLFPDDPLTQVAAPLDDLAIEVPSLAADMLETMRAYDGIGLAGPQIGLARQILVLQEPEHAPMCLINPEIVDAEGEEEGEEGCLSLPYLYGMVPRYTRIRVRALNEHGRPQDIEAQGFLARIIQHEIDHLRGTVFLNRLNVLSQQEKFGEWAAVRAKLIEGAP